MIASWCLSLICHGVLATPARWRARVVAYGRVLPEPTAALAPDGPRDQTKPRAWTWSALMHRAFGKDQDTSMSFAVLRVAYALA